MEQVQNLLKAGDSFAAVEYIQRDGSPAEIAGRYHSLVKDLYWKSHDLAALITIGRAGILYCLSQSHVTGLPPDAIDKLRSHAKAIAYDIGSFSWPGWEEPGINPGPAELATGNDCALLNLRLAIELKKPADRLSAAYWLAGAHDLSSGNFDSAEKHFQTAAEMLPVATAESRTHQLLNHGYMALAQCCRDRTNEKASAHFEEIISQLNAQVDNDAKAFASQLVTAGRVFVNV